MSAPVEVLKLIPGGVALMAKLAMAPPVELIVNPVAAVLTVRVSEEEESVKAGAANGTAAGATTTTGRALVVMVGLISDVLDEPSILTALTWKL